MFRIKSEHLIILLKIIRIKFEQFEQEPIKTSELNLNMNKISQNL